MIAKENVIVYGLGKCWEQYADRLMQDYNILYCSDKNEKMFQKGKGIPYISPEQIKDLVFDKLIVCNYLLGITKEELMYQYGIDFQKIVYCLEVYENILIYPEKAPATNCDKLTIVIPTYNRKERLCRTLDLLQLQTNQNYKIIILDNNSDYDVVETIENRSEEFRKKVKLIRNISNIGMPGNLTLSFTQEAEGWIWTLADDDIPSVYAVEIIHQEIEHANNVGIISFSIDLFGKYIQGSHIDFDNLSDMLSFYQRIMTRENINMLKGDFIFFSNKIYNTRKIKEYLKIVFPYLCTAIPQNLLILSMLDKKDGKFRISDKKIVGYNSPDGDHWNWLDTGLGMATLSDFPLDISEKERSVLYRLCMLDYEKLIQAAKEDGSRKAINKLKKMYDRLYQYCLSENEKQVYLNTLKNIEKMY